MTLKRKAQAKSDNPSPSKRPKLDIDPTYPCQLCTSTDGENVVTINIKVTVTSKGKQLDALTGHEKCIKIIPELDWAKGKDTAKICAANLPSYKTRFRLKCNLCPESHGAKVQCSLDKCLQSFHINCAAVGKDMVFDTEIDTYGLYPWVLLCARHNQIRLKSKAPPSPVSSGRAPSMRASPSPPPDSSPSIYSGTQEELTVETAAGSTAMSTPSGTGPMTPNMSASPSGQFLPPSPPLTSEDTPMTPITEPEPLDEEMAGNADDEEAVLQQPEAFQKIALTPEQIKIVSDFMYMDPTWDALIREALAQYAPSTSTSNLISVQ